MPTLTSMFAACALWCFAQTLAPPVQLPRSASQPLHGQWQWLGSERPDGTSTRPDDPSQYTLEFKAAGVLTVQADCNTVLGSYTVTGSELSIQLGPSTLVACPPGSSADEFTRDLARVRGYFMTDDQLLLELGPGGGTMTFTPLPTPDLVGTVWQATSVNNGRGGLQSVLLGTSLSATFSGGQVSGSGGCNRFFGPFSRTGDSISIGPLATTRVACAPDIMQQEAAYVAALEASTRWSQRGNQLRLEDASGAAQVTFEST